MFEECRISGDFTLSSGKRSSFFYDFDLLKPGETAKYAQSLWASIPRSVWNGVDFVAAPALGGIIPGFLLAFASDKPLVLVDKENKIRGPEFKKAKYLVVDDVITTYGAVKKVQQALDQNVCVGVAAFVFRGQFDIMQSFPFETYYLHRGELEV